MTIITAADLTTKIYQEIIDEITREDTTIVDNAIDTAVAEAKTFLSRYDLLKLFGDDVTEPVTQDAYLRQIIKDITAWYIISLGNVNLHYEHIRTCYEDAVSRLKDIQAGKMNPDWPYQDKTDTTAEPGISVAAYANKKRTNRF